MTPYTMDDTVHSDERLGSATAARADLHVSMRGVHKVFRRRRQVVEALRSVDLDVGRGEFVSLLGPSGCGKSTLLRVIGGLVEPDGGVVEVAGQQPTSARKAKQYGLVPQTPALMPWATVERNVRFLSSLDSNRRSDASSLSDDDIDELIDTVGLANFRTSYPHELSGGMQQRVSLVRGFALGAPILLMDEPFAALDEITRAEMRYLLLDLWQRTGTTVVFVTHSITEAVILSDRVVMMAARPGRIAAVEPISLGRPRLPEMEDAPEFHEHVRILRDHLQDHHA
jgi:NitT/TauT family transport system ATP-binding protein